MVVVVVLVMMVVLGVVALVSARRGGLPGATGEAARFRSDPVVAGTGSARSCRCGIAVGWTTISWPIGRLTTSPDQLAIRAPGMRALATFSPVPTSVAGRTVLDAVRVRRVRRVGALVQWGVVLELDEGKLGLWGPSVRATLAGCGLPSIVADRRRPFWAWELRNAGPPAAP